VLLGAVGTALGWYLGGWACEGPCGVFDVSAQPIIAGAVLGIAVGVFGGGLIGSRVARWHTVYQHPDP
jgi:hypothetical protein